MSRWALEGFAVRRPAFTVGPVDAVFAPGEATVVVGANGAGKSTLLRGIAGLEAGTTGRLTEDGVDRRAAPPEHRRIGYLPPGLGLFPHRTVLGNLTYPGEVQGRPEARQDARVQLERLRLADLADRYPRTLSTGEQQRVAVARALCAGPHLLLWDEPAAALDLTTRAAFHRLLREVKAEAEIPLVFVTHDPSDAFGIADRYLRLEGGRVLRSGTLAEFGGRPRSAFDARFLGFPNVYGPGELDGAGELRAWLRARAGSGGLAWAARSVRIGTSRGSVATVRRVEPRADAFLYRIDTEGLDLVAEAPAESGGLAPGTPVRVTVDEAALWPRDA